MSDRASSSSARPGQRAEDDPVHRRGAERASLEAGHLGRPAPGRLVARTSRRRPAASRARSRVRRSEVGSAQCRSSRTSTVGPAATRRETSERQAANVGPLEFPRAHPSQRRSRRQAHHARQQREQVAVRRTAASARSRAGRDHRLGLVGRHARPVGQQLLVEAVGGGRGVGGAAPLQPQGRRRPGHAACGTPAPGGSCRARARRSPARPSRGPAPPRAGPCRAPPARPAGPPAGRGRPAGPAPRRAGPGLPQVGRDQRLRCRRTRSLAPQVNRCSVAALVTGPTRAEPGLASDCSAAAAADHLAHGPVLDPGRRRRWDPAPPGRSPPRSAASVAVGSARYRRQGAEGGPGRPLGVVLVRLGRPEHGLQAAAGHRGHRAAERLHLGDHRGQRTADHVAQVLRVQLLASPAGAATSADSTVTVRSSSRATRARRPPRTGAGDRVGAASKAAVA